MNKENKHPSPSPTIKEGEQQEGCIIITQNEEQVKQLHVRYRGNFKNEGFWGQKHLDYEANWIWLLKGGKLSGSSGYHSFEHTTESNPELPIFTFNQLANWQKNQQPKGEQEFTAKDMRTVLNFLEEFFLTEIPGNTSVKVEFESFVTELANKGFKISKV